MATEILFKQGTVKTFDSAGTDAAITLTSLANGAARQSAYLDLGATMAAEYNIKCNLEFAAAPTAGTSVYFYLAFSETTSLFPGGCSGSDAAYKAAEEAEWAKQLMLGGVLTCTNDGDGTDQIQMVGKFTPRARYIALVVLNSSGQALSATAGDHVIKFVPIILESQ